MVGEGLEDRLAGGYGQFDRAKSGRIQPNGTRPRGGYGHPPVTRRPCWCKECVRTTKRIPNENGVPSYRAAVFARAGLPSDYWIKVTRKEG